MGPIEPKPREALAFRDLQAREPPSTSMGSGRLRGGRAKPLTVTARPRLFQVGVGEEAFFFLFFPVKKYIEI